ncbi:hypothetical protein OEG86_06155 [Hoeflea alexandrii]|uniref:hypothetical protein n=1 Tax=Hoeflea alexandrii TaxID=288436 RepID=UPI00226D797F|nr:hypothetical protein [Hoeflea alexandrii]MCY0151903.1 hypothetical protein [Hoeflea alexandrii]
MRCNAGREWEDQPQWNTIQRVDIRHQPVEGLGATQPHQQVMRGGDGGGQQPDPDRRQCFERGVVGQQPFAITCGGPAKCQKADHGRGPEDIEDRAHPGQSRSRGCGDEPSGKAEKRDPGDQHDKAQRGAADQRG